MLFFIEVFLKKLYIASMKKIIFAFLSVIALFNMGCNKGGEKTTFTMKDIAFTLSGPLYEGSNPGQYIVQVDLKTILGDKFHNGAKITGATLKNATIKALDSGNFNDISSFVLSIASDNADLKMKELAVLNPVPAGSKQVVLKAAEEISVDDYFGEKQFYVIVDATLSKDRDPDLKFLGDFEFELEYK